MTYVLVTLEGGMPHGQYNRQQTDCSRHNGVCSINVLLGVYDLSISSCSGWNHFCNVKIVDIQEVVEK